MRDKYDNDTADLWGEPPPFLTKADVLRRLPRVQIQGTCVVLVGHPHLPPIGFAELKRVGTITSILKDRMRFHQERARAHTYQNSAELPAHRSSEGMRHRTLVIRYMDAISDFERAALLTEPRRRR